MAFGQFTLRTPFCLIGRLPGRYPVATEFPLGRWPLVIGAVVYPLCLTALGLRGVFLGGGNQSGSKRCLQLVSENQENLPFQKGDSRSWTSSPLQISTPKDAVSQWHPIIKLYSDRLDKAGVQPEGGWRFFGSLLCVQK